MMATGGPAVAGALAVISAMVTPALFILAAASLASSALVRMGRVVDRARALAATAEEGRLERLGITPDLMRRWLLALRSRAKWTALAVAALYGAIVLFVSACLTIGFLHLGAALPEWSPLVLVLSGTLLLLGAAVWLAGETITGHRLVVEEIDNAISHLEKAAAE